MAVILDFPPELLELVFHHLGSIDDVHHLGRACKKTYSIVKRKTLYIEIMRSIIRKSPQHRFDLQLCRMLELHRNIVGHMQEKNSHLPATQSNQFMTTLNTWESALGLATAQITCENMCCSNCLPSETIYEVLARYQGLRVLEDMWLQRQLTGSDYLSADQGSDAKELTASLRMLVDRYELYMADDLPPRSSSTPETIHYTAFTADQRARFHSALTCVWLLNEIRWVFTNFVFPTRFSVQVSLLETCKINIGSQSRISVLEELDQHAVFKFMYHHLLPIYGTCLQDRNLSMLPFTFSSDFTKDRGHSARLLQLFLSAGQTYLQPPDLIDLAVRSQTSRRHPYAIVTLPPTTEAWQRPSRLFVFPADIDVSLNHDLYKRVIQHATLTHLNVIARSSFHQTQQIRSPTVNEPANDQLYALKDHASYYFLDRALVAFELHENPAKKLRNIREVFLEEWGDNLWGVWWWGNSEDKVRARLERWRAEPRMAKGRRRA
ncbi:hypothetical protein CC86DRAFT_8359 [Ophiobolus disseminans]|uniref:F-box domain-containing protein n=1 Tax=Ophiobolus disseminans TaxID=1469910 RepID=A0A6A7AJ54_9PLEO|nr:hypothetical protein CC86DRAFT_8359 [Ophiobolus disseminans]